MGAVFMFPVTFEETKLEDKKKKDEGLYKKEQHTIFTHDYNILMLSYLSMSCHLTYF